MLELSGVTAGYGHFTALWDVSLRVAEGEAVAVVGPNGAGKTTTVNVLTTLMKADDGTVRVAGHDVATEAKAVRAAIGVTGQLAAVDDLLTGEEAAPLGHVRDAVGHDVVGRVAR